MLECLQPQVLAEIQVLRLPKHGHMGAGIPPPFPHTHAFNQPVIICRLPAKSKAQRQQQMPYDANLLGAITTYSMPEPPALPSCWAMGRKLPIEYKYRVAADSWHTSKTHNCALGCLVACRTGTHRKLRMAFAARQAQPFGKRLAKPPLRADRQPTRSITKASSRTGAGFQSPAHACTCACSTATQCATPLP